MVIGRRISVDQSLERMMEFGLGEIPPLGRMVNRVMFEPPNVGTNTVSLEYLVEFVDWSALDYFEAMNAYEMEDDPL